MALLSVFSNKTDSEFFTGYNLQDYLISQLTLDGRLLNYYM